MEKHHSAPLTLRILGVGGEELHFRCDSVRLTERDREDGHGGGSRGIRRGHVRALIALGAGPLRATLGDAVVFAQTYSGGLASVEDNVVTVFPQEPQQGGESPAD